MTVQTIFSERPWYQTYEKYGIDPQMAWNDDVGSLLDVFDGCISEHKDSIAMTSMGVSMTYGELDVASRKIAAYLQSLGLQQGDKVAVMMPNVMQYPICMFGIIRAGYTLVNVNPLYTAHELEHQLNDADAKVLFIIENFAKTFEQVKNKGQVKHVIVASVGDMMGLKGLAVNFVVRHIKKMVPSYHIAGAISFKEALSKVPVSHYVRPQLDLDDVAVLQYTGGTTGVAKGAMLSHRNLISNVEQATNFVKTAFPDGNIKGQYMAVALPLYHIFCFMVSLLAMKLGFSLLLIINARDFDDLTKQFAKYRPAFFPAVNTLFNALTNHKGFKGLDHSNLRLALGGGMSVLPSTAKAWEAMTSRSITEGYGLSETSPVLTVNPPPMGFTGKIGIPLPNTDVVILDDDGNEVALGEAGEICAKGPQVMKGYYKRDDETAKVMTQDGYFRTGDIGVMDADGFVKIVDRKKDMILVSGFNVYPNEVEEAIAAHPKVLECGVIGVPDNHSGEVVKVYVVKKDASLDEKEVQNWAKQHLTGYKRPKHIAFIDELPKSNVGKILRKELRNLEK
ncbi:AMP-binding protein [Moraxella nasicaprae]|uniref:Long-chain-fatty-acid--CoA ligase n=1 Tax=Moraxella nasicaprae TaxID=2904122 RepID=A0ABY6F5Y5_9GAMM|nr:AMP-binding protein [Moraxella nasicaprae]UXZ05453.1 AMP-binding protein [Moraxella nasicaprae]